MSAFMVSDETLIALACEITRRDKNAGGFGLVIPQDRHDWDRLATARDVLSRLHRANVASLRARYPRGTEWDDAALPVLTEAHLSAPSRPVGAIAKMLACFEYQACEVPDWYDGENLAHRQCRWLANALLEDLPGYEAQEWG